MGRIISHHGPNLVGYPSHLPDWVREEHLACPKEDELWLDPNNYFPRLLDIDIHILHGEGERYKTNTVYLGRFPEARVATVDDTKGRDDVTRLGQGVEENKVGHGPGYGHIVHVFRLKYPLGQVSGNALELVHILCARVESVVEEPYGVAVP